MTKGQLLLNENEVKVADTDSPIKNKGALIGGMHSLLRQQPNTHWVDVKFMPRVKLIKYNSRYNFYKQNPESSKIRERKVEAPVIVNPALSRLSDSSLKQFMINYGYYYSEVSDTLIEKKNQEAKIVYRVRPGKQYFIKDVNYNIEDARILAIVNRASSKSYIKKGKAFRNIDFGKERERLYRLLTNQGYFAFKSENISCELDTIDRSGLKNIIDNPFGFELDMVSQPERKDSISVYINFALTRDTSYSERFTMERVYVKFIDPQNPGLEIKNEEMYKDIIFQYNSLPVNKNIIYQNIFIHPKQLFSTKNNEATYNRLNQLGTFQFVNIHYDKNPNYDNKLDCYIELTLATKRDIQLNADISNGEDYLLGLGAGINYNTRNLLRGANKLNLQALYSLETRPTNRDRILDGLLLSANNFNASANLSLPRFLLPFKWNTSRSNTPFTIISLAHSRINRVGSFKLISSTAKLSYNWKETPKKSWVVSPLFLSLTNVPEDKISEDFKKRISESRFLENTYSNNFIQGENVNFEYRSDLTGTASRFHTFNFGFEEAGLLMQGVNQLVKAIAQDSISNIAHYVRTDIDYRYFHRKRNFTWASRAMVGIGLPTFGDISLPYIKQYSQGGAYSNRGWQLRNLGPGRTLPDTTNGLQLVDRTGDLKLELNTELRFPLASVGPFAIKGATFIDAGNIWLINEDSTNVGGEFRLNKLWQDIAISSGLGLRLDFTFFVFRLDYAWRLKYPYKPENSGWDLKGLRLNDGQWNVAIGYPF